MKSKNYIIASVFTLACLGLLLGAPLYFRYLFSGLCLTVGTFWYFTRQYDFYFALLIIAQAFTPLLRRYVDYQVGFEAKSFLLATPPLIMGISLFSLVKFPFLKVPKMLWLSTGAMIAAIFLALPIGIFNNPLSATLQDFLGWLGPIGIFTTILQLRNDEKERCLKMVAALAVPVLTIVAAYGIYQFVAPPPWDRLWMQSTRMSSIGVPEPFRLRVFSTFNAPTPLSELLLFLIFFSLLRGGVLRWPAIALGMLTFGLSFVRSGWGALGVAAIFLFVWGSLKQRLQVIFIIFGLTFLTLTYAISYFQEFDVIERRVDTVLGIRDDHSLRMRAGLYEAFVDQLPGPPLGSGLGTYESPTVTNASGTKLSSLVDSGIIAGYITFGWIGSCLYFGGLFCLMLWSFLCLRGSPRPVRERNNLLFATALAMLSQLPFHNSLFNYGGVFFWLPLALFVHQMLKPDRSRGNVAPSPRP